ncbi:DUF3500 domain-containing protein [Streptomyces asoensis]|uniref:DUF3500 domain-containing protein n=1 Tax=Streptomyces asoensis TaxID=249586 RepID=UPI00379F29BB
MSGAGKDNLTLAHQGLAASGFTAVQREHLLDLVRVYVGTMDEGHARVRTKEVAEHLDETYFYRIGETADSSAFYYRVHSPVVLVEYDAQSPLAYGTKDGGGPGGPGGTPTQQHIHTIVRTPNGGDYGVDLLKLHLATDH